MRRCTPAWLALAVCLSVSGCGSDTGRWHPSIGSEASTSAVHARGVAAVTDCENRARLVGTLMNHTEEPVRLVEVAAKAEHGPVQATLDRPITIGPNEQVQLARQAAVTLRSSDLPEGRFIKLRFIFDSAPDLTMAIPVETPDGPYSGVEVTGSPNGTVAPTGERNGTPVCDRSR